MRKQLFHRVQINILHSALQVGYFDSDSNYQKRNCINDRPKIQGPR